MQFSLFLILVSIPIVFSLKCYIGDKVGTIDTMKEETCLPGQNYCMTVNIFLFGQNKIRRNCCFFDNISRVRLIISGMSGQWNEPSFQLVVISGNDSVSKSCDGVICKV